MNWSSAVLAFVFGVSFLMTVVAGGRVAYVVGTTYVTDLRECRYDYAPRPAPVPGDITAPREPEFEQECTIDYNDAKRDIIAGVSFLIFSVPSVLFTGWMLFSGRRKSP